jgi:hypothetical protein
MVFGAALSLGLTGFGFFMRARLQERRIEVHA